MQQRPRLWLRALAFGAVALAPADARAQPAPPLSLTWNAPADCPSREDVVASVGRLVAGSTTSDTLEVDARVSIDRRGVYRARLRTRLRGVRGERSIAAASCGLALTIDPTIAIEAPPAPLTAPAEPPATPERVDVVPPPPPSPPSPPKIAIVPGAAAALDVGNLASPAVGAELQLAVTRWWWSVVATAAAFPSQRASAPTEGRGGRLSLLAAAVRACVGGGALLRAEGCAGGELDRMHAEGFGVSSPGAATRVWFAPRVGARLAWRAASFLSVPLTVDVLVPFDRPSFVLENVGTVHRPAPVPFRATLGVALHFD